MCVFLYTGIYGSLCYIISYCTSPYCRFKKKVAGMRMRLRWICYHDCQLAEMPTATKSHCLKVRRVTTRAPPTEPFVRIEEKYDAAAQ